MTKPRWSSEPTLTAADRCLMRFPLLPADPAPGVDRHAERALLELAVRYAETFRRSGREPGITDFSRRQDLPLLAAYDNRARHRMTPFGLFAITMAADVGDGTDGPVQVDLQRDAHLHRLGFARPSGRWFVNATLREDGGRWLYVNDHGAVSSAQDTALLNRLCSLVDGPPRREDEWTSLIGAAFDTCVRHGLLIAELTPAPLIAGARIVDDNAGQPANHRVVDALAAAQPFKADEMVDTITTVRAGVRQRDVDDLLAGAAHVLDVRTLPDRLSRVRDYLAEHVTGGVVPLVWLLAATVDHPLGSWRRTAPLPPAPPAGSGLRLFVDRGRRDHSLAARLVADQRWEDWLESYLPTDGAVTGSPDLVASGVAVGARLASARAGARVWLKAVSVGTWLGPGARLADRLDVRPLAPRDDDPSVLVALLGWTPPDVRGPLTRRPAGDLPRININTPHRPGDVRLGDLGVLHHDGRLLVVHRPDGRFVDIHHDSPLAMTGPVNPWVIQLIGLLGAESGAVAIAADPLAALPPGGIVPRLTVGRCLIARRGVSVDATHRADLLALTAHPQQLADVLTDIGLGAVVEVAEGDDRVMRLDPTNPDDLRWFVRRLRREGPITLHESLPVDTPVATDLGRHLHELWVPWSRKRPPVGPPVSTRRMVDAVPTPDERWTGWHIYAPDTAVERWLATPAVTGLMRRGSLFYIRYRDDRPHLRVRVRSDAPDGLLSELRRHLAVAAPHHPVAVARHEWVPEDHRYGGQTLRDATAAHFCADSAWWASHLPGADVSRRFALAIARIAAWCVDLAGPDAFDLLVWLYGLDPRLPGRAEQREWMTTFRGVRPVLTGLLDEQLADPDAATPRHLSGVDDDAYRLALTSLVHMTVNRGLPLGIAVRREVEAVTAAARVLKARQLATRPTVLAHTTSRDRR